MNLFWKTALFTFLAFEVICLGFLFFLPGNSRESDFPLLQFSLGIIAAPVLFVASFILMVISEIYKYEKMKLIAGGLMISALLIPVFGISFCLAFHKGYNSL